jgi:hypothetical protein
MTTPRFALASMFPVCTSTFFTSDLTELYCNGILRFQIGGDKCNSIGIYRAEFIEAYSG